MKLMIKDNDKDELRKQYLKNQGLSEGEVKVRVK